MNELLLSVRVRFLPRPTRTRRCRDWTRITSSAGCRRRPRPGSCSGSWAPTSPRTIPSPRSHSRQGVPSYAKAASRFGIVVVEFGHHSGHVVLLSDIRERTNERERAHARSREGLSLSLVGFSFENALWILCFRHRSRCPAATSSPNRPWISGSSATGRVPSAASSRDATQYFGETSFYETRFQTRAHRHKVLPKNQEPLFAGLEIEE